MSTLHGGRNRLAKAEKREHVGDDVESGGGDADEEARASFDGPVMLGGDAGDDRSDDE